MNGNLPVTILDFPVKQFAEELKSINDVIHAFSNIEVPRDPSHEKGLIFSSEAVTIVVAGVNTVALLVNSILVFLGKRKSGSVRIVTSTGQALEFPYDAQPEAIQAYLEIAQKMEVQRLVVRVQE